MGLERSLVVRKRLGSSCSAVISGPVSPYVYYCCAATSRASAGSLGHVLLTAASASAFSLKLLGMQGTSLKRGVVENKNVFQLLLRCDGNPAEPTVQLRRRSVAEFGPVK